MKGLQVKKKVRSYKKVQSYEKGTKLQKGTKLRKGYEVTKRVRSYKKCYEVTNMVRSYEKGTKMLRNKLRKTLVMKLSSYEIVTPPIGCYTYIQRVTCPWQENRYI